MTETCTQHKWKAPDGAIFSYSRWKAILLPDQEPRAVVVAVHGLSGAALDFEPLGNHFAKHGIVTFALELRGQGNDPVKSRRGDLVKIQEWYDDLSAFLALVRCRFPETQIYYYGESMGAVLLTRFMAQAHEPDRPAGMILASPVVAVMSKPTQWQQMIFRFLLWVKPWHRIDVRKLTKKDKDDPAGWVTRDEAHRRWFETASHKLDNFTVRFFKNLFDLIGGCFEDAERIRVPVLVMYASNDVFVPPAQVEKFYTKLGSREKQLRLFSDSYHHLLHDHDKAKVLAQIETWLLARIEETNQRKISADEFTG
jgi:acylglycerol lipase